MIRPQTSVDHASQHAAAPWATGAGRQEKVPEEMRAADFRHGEIEPGREGSVRAAVVALVLTVVSALAIFPFILPTIPV